MVVLALDTTMRGGSCALARDGVLVREEAGDGTISQAARLPGELMVLLEATRTPLDDVDVFAVATGPGSFTGLRVGIATMQGLAFAEGKPLVGVSTFDALAVIGAAGAPSGRQGEQIRVATWVDAWRGDVFAALYEDGREVHEPAVADPQEALARLRQSAGGGEGSPVLFIGDGAALHRDLIRQVLGPVARLAEPPDPLVAGAVAMQATNRARQGELPPPHAIRPLYVRRSDAELARMARHARPSR